MHDMDNDGYNEITVSMTDMDYDGCNEITVSMNDMEHDGACVITREPTWNFEPCPLLIHGDLIPLAITGYKC